MRKVKIVIMAEVDDDSPVVLDTDYEFSIIPSRVDPFYDIFSQSVIISDPETGDDPGE